MTSGTAPEDGGHAEQDHQQAERHHERPLDRGAVDAAEEHELDHDGQQRRLDEDDERDGEQEGPVPFCHSSQYEKAATMPTAPWAKLKTPVVL